MIDVTNHCIMSPEFLGYRRWVCETLHSEGHCRGQAAAASRGAAAEAEAAAACDSLQASGLESNISEVILYVHLLERHLSYLHWF